MAITDSRVKRRRTKKRQRTRTAKHVPANTRSKRKVSPIRSTRVGARRSKRVSLKRPTRRSKRSQVHIAKRMKKTPFIRRVKPWMFLVGLTIGLNLLLISGWYLLYSKTVLSFATIPQVTARLELRGSIPTKIEIPSISLSQLIELGSINDKGVWSISPSSATYLDNSARPAEGSNIVVYGHNKNAIFGGLRRVKLQDKITLTTESGKTYEYEVGEIAVVKPTDIVVVLPTDNEVLTVYTCTGFLDSMRLVIKAYPKGVR